MDRSGFTFWREKASLNPREVVMYTISVSLLLAASFAYIYPSIRSTSLMYDYTERIHNLEKSRELNKKLRLEVATLRSYELVEKKAVEEMGFIHPTPEQVVIIAKKRGKIIAKK